LIIFFTENILYPGDPICPSVLGKDIYIHFHPIHKEQPNVVRPWISNIRRKKRISMHMFSRSSKRRYIPSIPNGEQRILHLLHFSGSWERRAFWDSGSMKMEEYFLSPGL